MDQIVLKIHGLDCAQEAANLVREVGPLVGGGDRLEFDSLKGRMIVTVGADGPDTGAILKAVARTGMTAEIAAEDRGAAGRTAAAARGRQSRRRFTRRTAVTAASGVLVAAGFAAQAWLAGGVTAALRSSTPAAPG